MPWYRINDKLPWSAIYSLELPDGLHGAHSRSFIIPDEVPFPDGPKCHNSFYWMDGSKMGPGGRRSGGEKELDLVGTTSSE